MEFLKFEYFKKHLISGDFNGVNDNIEPEFVEQTLENVFKWRPIHIACEKGYIDIARLLIDQNCNIEIEDVDRWRAIHYACWFNHIAIVKLLINQKCNIECETVSKRRPMHLACEKGNIDIVRLLIDEKCNIESEEAEKRRPIHVACKKGHIDIVELLINQKCNIESEGKNLKRPIHYACLNYNTDLVKFLINQNCNIECEDGDKKRPVHLACDKGYNDVVKLLINEQCNIECEDNDKRRPVHYASSKGYKNIMKLLINQSCNIESEDCDQRRPIHLACDKGYSDIVKLLINKKCNIKCEDIYKWRPIHIVCNIGDVDILQLLINENCVIECEENEKKRPIHLACDKGYSDIVKLLINEKCNIECEENDKRRPIHISCMKGNVDIVKLLINQQCNIECEDIFNIRPFHYACFNGHFEIAKLLIEHKCEMNPSNKFKMTPLFLAKLMGHHDIVELIEKVINLPKQIHDSVINNDEKVFEKYFTPDILTSINFYTGLSWLQFVLEARADRIIRVILDRPLDDFEIDCTEIVLKDDSNSDDSQLLAEILFFKSIRDNHQEAFHLTCCARVINEERKIIPCSFLELAAECGSFVFVNEILKKSIYDRETWEKSKEIALNKGYYEIVNSIKNRESLLECRENANLSILHTSVCDNDPDMTEYILKKGLVDPNHNHEILGTALALAIVLCHEKCISVLERFNVNCNTQNKYSQTPLHDAICIGLIEHCNYLIDHIENINEKGFMGMTALHCAVIHGSEEICEQLVKRGADIIEYMKFLQQSLDKVLKKPEPISKRENSLTLCMKINKTIYSCFLEHLDVNKANTCDDDGNSLLHLAVKQYNEHLCNSLVKAGADVDSTNKLGNSPVFELLSSLDHQSFQQNSESIIKIVHLFVESGCDAYKRFKEILQIAFEFDCERLLIALLPPKQSPLLVINEDLFLTSFNKKYLRLSEALLNLVPHNHLVGCISPEIINMALIENCNNLLKSLIIHANVDIKEMLLEKVLHYFAVIDDEDSFKCLLNIKITKPKLFENGETLLTEMLKEKNLNFCQKIFESEKNDKMYINFKNEKNQTPLQVAIGTELIDILHYLIFETHNLDNVDCEGQSALTQLFMKISDNDDNNQHLELLNVIRIIVYEGGDIYRKTASGIEIIEFCRSPEMRKEVQRFFKNKQKRKMVEVKVRRSKKRNQKVLLKQEEKKRNKKKKEKICQLCFHKEMVFPCGHTACQNCGVKCVQCPICDFCSTETKRFSFNDLRK